MGFWIIVQYVREKQKKNLIIAFALEAVGLRGNLVD